MTSLSNLAKLNRSLSKLDDSSYLSSSFKAVSKTKVKVEKCWAYVCAFFGFKKPLENFFKRYSAVHVVNAIHTFMKNTTVKIESGDPRGTVTKPTEENLNKLTRRLQNCYNLNKERSFLSEQRPDPVRILQDALVIFFKGSKYVPEKP